MSSKTALTSANLALLGALDDFYNSYSELIHLYKQTYSDKTDDNSPSIWSIEKIIKKNYITVLEKLLSKYSYIFVDSPPLLHANPKYFESFSLLKKVKKQILSFRLISFQDFLSDIQYRIAMICYHNKSRWKQFSFSMNFNEIYVEINDHILFVVERSKNNIVITNNLTISSNIEPLFVFELLSSTKCHKENHSVISKPFFATKIDDSEIIVFPTHYCKDCRKHLIGRITLEIFDKQFGKTTTERQSESTENFNASLCESKLHQLGYNVIDGILSETERHTLLVSILSKELMTYFEICQVIERNIKIFNGIEKYKLAVRKWECDLKYLGEYIINSN